jgi:hypothetical protein
MHFQLPEIVFSLDCETNVIIYAACVNDLGESIFANSRKNTFHESDDLNFIFITYVSHLLESSCWEVELWKRKSNGDMICN